MRAGRALLGDEAYARVSQSKNTKPAAIADTMTKCMDPSSLKIIVDTDRAGNQRAVQEYREIELLAIDFKVLDIRIMKRQNCRHAVRGKSAEDAV